MKFIIILFVFLIILFIPIPIRFTFKLNNNEASLFFYSKKIQLKKNDKATKKAKVIKHKIFHRPKFLNTENIYFTMTIKKPRQHSPNYNFKTGSLKCQPWSHTTLLTWKISDDWG